MTREIKFRLKVPSGEILSHEQCLERGYSWKVLNDPDSFIAMQFTGLKDKNGVEIYEGDIVTFDSEDGVVTAQVVFKVDDEGETIWWSGFCCKAISVEDYEDDNPVELNVIGNIYANPEARFNEQGKGVL